MEMNQNSVQEQPVQQIVADSTSDFEVQAAILERTTEHQSSLSENRPQYNQGEADAIVNYLTQEGLFDPEYILLFGSLAGGPMHSEAKCYDLLLVVRNQSAYNWLQAKRDLRYKLPFRW